MNYDVPNYILLPILALLLVLGIYLWTFAINRVRMNKNQADSTSPFKSANKKTTVTVLILIVATLAPSFFGQYISLATTALICFITLTALGYFIFIKK